MHTVIYQHPEFHQYGLWSMLGRRSETTVLRLGKKALGKRGGALAGEVSEAAVGRSIPVRTADVGVHVPVHSATEGTQMYNPTRLQLRNPALRPSAETGFQILPGRGQSVRTSRPTRTSRAVVPTQRRFERRGGGSSWSPPRPKRSPSQALAIPEGSSIGAPSRRVSINWKRVGLAGGGAAGLVGGGYLLGRRRTS